MNLRAILLIISAARHLIKSSNLDKLIAHKLAEMNERRKHPRPKECEGLIKENEELVRALSELKVKNEELITASEALVRKYIRLKNIFAIVVLAAALGVVYLLFKR